ncbi:MAG: hypothetical protein SGJ21_17495 [Alphaproteobacteria bacterium]|nr:hypothetical protein [Alphaproteobacteria bacterium]
MTDIIQWAATITGIAAAIMVAGKFSTRITGIGFLVFAVSSVGWIAFAVIEGELPLTIQNGMLLLINLFGVYRYLIMKERDNKAA